MKDQTPQITRYFGWPTRFPTSNTSRGRGSLQTITKILKPYGGAGWVDPMCGLDSRCEYRNDIRSARTAGIAHLDAVEWLKSLPTGQFKGVIYDPPYNDNQGQKYTKLHHTKADLAYWYEIRRELSRILVPKGKIVMLAWNTNSFPDCVIKELYVISHGSERNDTLISIHEKVGQKKLI